LSGYFYFNLLRECHDLPRLVFLDLLASFCTE